MKNNYTVRLESEKDWKEVENLTREAFWNKYRPGCTEHYVLHKFRNLPDFVKDLDYVIEEDGRVVAHIMYCKSEIKCDDGRIIPIMTFGPVSVLPECQGRGYGGELIRFTMEKARELGCGAIAITGNPDYYQQFGFVSGHSMQIYYAAVPKEEEAPFFMIKELQPGYLTGITGTFQDPDGYIVEDADVEEFDKDFSPKEKKKLPGQLEQVAIRLVTPEDYETILAMNQESVHFLSPLTAEKLQWLHEESEFSSVVEVNGQVGAFLIALREGSSYDSLNYTWFAGRYEKFLYIDRVVVFQKHQGKGLGTLLYKDAFQRAALMEIPVITAEIDVEPPNPGSLKFHKEFGFSEVGTQSVCDGKKQVSLQAVTLNKVYNTY